MREPPVTDSHPAKAATLHNRVIDHYAGLSPRLRKAADYVLANPVAVATHSLRQVAGASNVSPPTLSRLARSIGFDRYESMRELCRAELTRGQSTLAEKAAALVSLPSRCDTTADNLLVSQARASLGNIRHLIENIELSELAESADLLAGARRVLLVGSLSSAAVMHYVDYVASIAFDNWHILDDPRESRAAQLHDVEARDVVLALAVSPYATRSIAPVQHAKQAGARVIVVTDGPRSPLAAHATHRHLVSAGSPQFFPSHVAALVLLETLLGMVACLHGTQAQQRIAQVEKMSHALGEYCRA